SKVKIDDAGRTVEAWDLHGQLVVSYSCEDLYDDVCGPAAEEEETAEEECGDEHTGGGDPQGGGANDTPDSGGAGDTPDSGDGGECPPPPSECGAMEEWARDCFCQKVNDSIVQVGLTYTIDCDDLDAD